MRLPASERIRWSTGRFCSILQLPAALLCFIGIIDLHAGKGALFTAVIIHWRDDFQTVFSTKSFPMTGAMYTSSPASECNMLTQHHQESS